MTRTLALLASLALAACSSGDQAADDYAFALRHGSAADACAAANSAVRGYLDDGDQREAAYWTTTRDLACAGHPPDAP